MKARVRINSHSFVADVSVSNGESWGLSPSAACAVGGFLRQRLCGAARHCLLQYILHTITALCGACLEEAIIDPFQCIHRQYCIPQIDRWWSGSGATVSVCFKAGKIRTADVCASAAALVAVCRPGSSSEGSGYLPVLCFSSHREGVIGQ